jgi:hypothetical protein
MVMESNPHEVVRVEEFQRTIQWTRMPGANVYLDPELRRGSGNVYRYVTPTPEAISLLNDRRMRFDHPTVWPDRYESYIADHMFDGKRSKNSSLGGEAPFDGFAIYAKCMTYHYASEAMWRLGPGKVRLSFNLERLLQLLSTARRVDGGPMPKIYVCRARYMEPKKIRQAIGELRHTDAKTVSRLIVPALLMKRVGFHFENEIRICIVHSRAAKRDFLDLEFDEHGIEELMVNPYADKYSVIGLKNAFGNYGFDVKQSAFDLDPLSL